MKKGVSPTSLVNAHTDASTGDRLERVGLRDLTALHFISFQAAEQTADIIGHVATLQLLVEHLNTCHGRLLRLAEPNYFVSGPHLGSRAQ